jgi:hypothetical protein
MRGLLKTGGILQQKHLPFSSLRFTRGQDTQRNIAILQYWRQVLRWASLEELQLLVSSINNVSSAKKGSGHQENPGVGGLACRKRGDNPLTSKRLSLPRRMMSMRGADKPSIHQGLSLLLRRTHVKYESSKRCTIPSLYVPALSLHNFGKSYSETPSSPLGANCPYILWYVLVFPWFCLIALAIVAWLAEAKGSMGMNC